MLEFLIMIKRIKRLPIITVVIIACTTIISCKENEEIKQAEGKSFYARIFSRPEFFPESPDSVRVLNFNSSYEFKDIGYSPSDKVDIAWKVNGEVFSSERSFVFKGTEPGDYRITLEVSYNGDTARRHRNFFVLPAPQFTYQPKTYTKVVLSYLSDSTTNRAIADIDFNKVTHVAYKLALVNADGSVNYNLANQFRRLEYLKARAHLNGVPVLLGISGNLTGDGWALNNSFNFGNSITNVTRRATLVQSIRNFITTRGLDGVDIMLTDINGAAATVTPIMQALGPFLNDLRAALGSQAIITATVAGDLLQDRYPPTSLTAANWLNVHAFDDGRHYGPGKVLGQPSTLAYLSDCAEKWRTKFDNSKLVFGISAKALRYLNTDANGNNLSWTSFNFISYKRVIYLFPDAYDKEYVPLVRGTYFTGVPLATSKASYIKTNNFLGAYLWASDGDVSGKNDLTGATGEKSLTAAIYNALH